MLLTLLCGAALAGDLVVDAAVPVEVRSQGAALVSVLSHARVRVLDLPPGSQSIELSRDGKVQTVTVSIPDQGAALITVGEGGAVVAKDPAPPVVVPSLELRAAGDQRFATVIDGERILTWSGVHPVVLEGLAPGARELQLRSADLLTIWARGTLSVEPIDRLIGTLNAGRALSVLGRSGAFAPYTGPSGPPTPEN